MGTENSEDAQKCLHIGDTVFLYLRERNGYVYSELTGSRYNRVTVMPTKPSPSTMSAHFLQGRTSLGMSEDIEREDKDPGFPNVAFATFTVVGTNKYKAQQRLDQLLSKREKSGGVIVEDSELIAAEKEVELETKQNQIAQKKNANKAVVFGEKIQLRHVASKKYVSLSSEHTSKTENNSLLVQLTDEISDLCVFVIQPRYKFRTEGDLVCFGDQIKLESLNTPGQFLHCSSMKLSSVGVSVQPNQFELNLSATESSITLVPHYVPSANYYHANALRGGCCLRLFHREDECYLVAEGSFAEQFPIVEDVHCRQRRVGQKSHSKPSTSANTFWQIEKQSDSRSGEVISWRECCRIRHMPTRAYLAVELDKNDMGTSSVKVFLKESKLGGVDPDTLFTFHPLIEEGDEMVAESYARIKHILSGQFLHLVDEEQYIPSKESNGLQETTKLFKLGTTNGREDFDAFTLQEVEEPLLDIFNYVAGIVPILSQHIEDVSSGEQLSEKEAAQIISVLDHLCCWLSEAENNREAKNRQKMLRNLGILEQLLEILKKSDANALLMSSLHVTICQKCYDVIQQYLKGDSRKNENYISRFLKFFQDQIGKGLNAENVLVEIVQDNIAIVTKMADTQMDIMIAKLCEKKAPVFLHFLGSLCVCSGRPIRKTQDNILRKLFHTEEGMELFLQTKVIKRGYDTTVCCRLNDGDTVEVTKLTSEQNEFKMLEAQVLLFARLCQGSNLEAIEELKRDDDEPGSQGYVSLDEAITCASNKSLNPALRSCYVKLILSMFVNIGRNTPYLNNLCYSFSYDYLVENPYQTSAGDETQALSGEVNQHFPVLKKWIVRTLRQNEWLRCEKDFIAHNQVIAQIVDVLRHLVIYGYYDSMKDCEEVIDPLLMMLENQQKYPEFKSKKTLSKSPENKSIFAVNEKILEVINMFMKFNGYVTLQRLMYDYKQLETQSEVDPSLQVLDCLRPAAFREQDNTGSIDLELTRMARERMKHITSKNFNFPHMKDILINVARYQDDRMTSLALNLLINIYFFENSLFSQASEVQLIVANESISVYQMVEEVLRKLRHLLSIDSSVEGHWEIVGILDQLISLCKLPNDDDEPHQQNQQLLRNFGVLSEILNFVLAKGTLYQSTALQRKMSTFDASYCNVQQEVFTHCLRLIHALACKNEQVQRRLFDRLDDLLEVKVSIPTLADLINEIFIGTPELCLKVKEEVIERIFDLVLDSDDDYTKAQLLETLQALAKIEGLNLPVKRNQALIVKNYCQHSDKICSSLTGEGKEKEKRRWKLITTAERDNPQLQLLLSLTDLLSTCAEGENLFIDSVCQNLYTAEELLKIINAEQLSITRKRPFLRFLIWVYFDTDAERTSKQALSHGEPIWNFLTQVSQTLGSIHSILHRQTATEENDLKKLRASKRRKTIKSVKPPTANPLSISYNISNVSSEDGQLVLSILDYLTEGVIPLLHVFYTVYFDPVDIGEEQLSKELTISAKIANGLINLSSRLLSFTTNKTQLQLFHETMLTLYGMDSIRAKLNVNPELIVKFNQKVEKQSLIVSHNLRCYQQTFSKQLHINRDFKGFVKRYQEAFMGPNTAQHQINSKVEDLAYSDLGEELPLGPNFQELVAYFMSSPPGRVEVVETGVTRCISGRCDKPETTLDTVRPEAELLLRQLEISLSENLTEVEQEVQDTLDIRCLQVLRGLIHNRIKLIDPEMKDREPVVYRSLCEEYVHPIQMSLQQFGNAVERITPLLSHSNEEIAKEVLALLKALLFSGNRLVQEGFEYVKNTREEKLFMKIKSRLDFAMIHYEECCVMRQILKSRQDFSKSLMSTSTLNRKTRSSTITSRIIETPLHVSVPLEPDENNHDNESDDLQDRGLQASLIKLAPLRQRSGKKNMLQLLGPKNESSVGNDFEAAPFLQPDISFTLVLEVLGLMCDGQWRSMQNYLRDQPDNFKSTNVVASVATLLQTYTSSFGTENYKHIHKILQTLIEISVGNPTNQLVILEKHVLESINHLLRLKMLQTDCDHAMTLNEIQQCSCCTTNIEALTVSGSAVELLEGMLEETSTKTANVISGVEEAIDRAALLKVMTYFHDMQSHPLVKAVQMDDDARRGMFRAYHIHLILSENSECPSREVVPDDYQQRVMSLCSEQTRSVEIHYETEEGKSILTKAYFPYTEQLREYVIEKVKWNISRDSMEVKQRALLDLFEPMKRDILHQAKMRKNIVTRILLSFSQLRHYFLILFTFFMVILILTIITDTNVPPKTPLELFLNTTPGNFFQAYGRYIFGPFHLLLGIWMLIEYFLTNLPHFGLPHYFYKAMVGLRINVVLNDHIQNEMSETQLWDSYTHHFKHLPVTFYHSFKQLHGRWIISKIYRIPRLKLSSSSKKKKLVNIPKTSLLDVNLFGLGSIWAIMFVAFSILGMALGGYFYCFCALHIVVNNDILQRVLRAVTKNGISLILVALLGLIIFIIYSVISYVFLHEYFYVDSESFRFCNGVGPCFVTVLKYGLLDNLGIIVPLVNRTNADMYTKLNDESSPVLHAFLRLFYDLSFFVIITIIGLNIVLGIIVDSFSALREERSNIEEALRSKCFICDLESHEFDRKAKGFLHHVKEDHNKWNYVYYSLYLDSIDTSNHNAIQQYVYALIKQGKPDFFPREEARCFEKEEDVTGQQLGMIDDQLNKLLQLYKAKELNKQIKTRRRERQQREERVLQFLQRRGSVQPIQSLSIPAFIQQQS